MRIPKAWVPLISKKIVDALLLEELITPSVEAEKLVAEVEKLIFDELEVEDRLNDEVRQMLKQYDSEIERGRLDYRKLFDLTKQKLIRERNIII